MSTDSDAVVIGGGHNALIAAAYLVRAGLSVTVLEERAIPGGDTTTEELTVPGFRHDPGSSFTNDLMFNPVVSADELGLTADHGLAFAAPDPVMVVLSGEAEPTVVPFGEEAMAAAIARYSAADAEAYRALLAEWRELAAAEVRELAVPPSGDEPAAVAGYKAATAVEVAGRRFGDERARRFLLAAATGGDPNGRGSGWAFVNLLGVRAHVSWAMPLGGLGALTGALVACVEAHGGQVLCGRRVDRTLVENGRAAGVLTAGGERFAARRAVVSAAHAKHLRDLLGGTSLPPEFGSLDRWRHGLTVLAVHLALPRIPEYRAADGPVRSVVAAFRDASSGMPINAVCSSVADPSRAPDGRATLKLSTPAPYALDGDPANWAEHAERFADGLVTAYARAVDGFEPGEELGRAVHTPADFERMNRHNIGGGFHGGEMSPGQTGVNRPVKGWSGYRMPVSGLYQTGASTHPGGGVTGWPGRNAARVVLDDLGIDPRAHGMGEAGRPGTMPVSSAGRSRPGRRG